MAIPDKVNSISEAVKGATAHLDYFVRGTIAFIIIGSLLWLEWHSPEPQAYAPPGSLMGVAGLVTGYYLSGSASLCMKGILSILYVVMFSAFMLRLGWAPEFIVGQVSIVIGIWYGQRAQAAQVTALKSALVTATNGKTNGSPQPQVTPGA